MREFEYDKLLQKKLAELIAQALNVLHGRCIKLLEFSWHVILVCRVLCWSRFSLSVLVRKSKSVWSQWPHCKAMHCFFPFTLCVTCWYFSSGWLLAPLARRVCWRSHRFVSMMKLSSFFLVNDRDETSFSHF